MAQTESTYNVGDLRLIPGLGRSAEGRNGNPLQYSCLENPMDRGVWWATVHRFAKSQTRLSDLRIASREERREPKCVYLKLGVSFRNYWERQLGKRDKDGALKTFTLFPPKLHWSDNNRIFVLRSTKQGLPGGSVVRNLPANAGDMGLSLVWGDPVWPWSNDKPLRHNYWQLLTREPTTREATAVRSLRTITRKQALLSAMKEPMQHGRPGAAQLKTKIIYMFVYINNIQGKW